MWDVGRTREKLVNHEPKASDLQAMPFISQIHMFHKIYIDTFQKMNNQKPLKRFS